MHKTHPKTKVTNFLTSQTAPCKYICICLFEWETNMKYYLLKEVKGMESNCN